MSKQTKHIPKRRTISLEAKIKILGSLESGAGPTSVGKDFDLNQVTIRTILKNANSIR